MATRDLPALDLLKGFEADNAVSTKILPVPKWYHVSLSYTHFTLPSPWLLPIPCGPWSSVA